MNDKEPRRDHMSNHKVLQKLHNIYIRAIKPLEEAYNFNELNTHVLSGNSMLEFLVLFDVITLVIHCFHDAEGDIFSSPTIVLFGAWSVGKTSLINYLINREGEDRSLVVGKYSGHVFYI